MRLNQSVKRELHHLHFSGHLQEAVIAEMRRLLKKARDAQTLIERYEQATGRNKSQLLTPSGYGRIPPSFAEDQRQPREPARYRHPNQRGAEGDQAGAERRVKVATEEFARSLEMIASGQTRAAVLRKR